MVQAGVARCPPVTVRSVASSVVSGSTASPRSQAAPSPGLVTGVLVGVIVLWGLGPPFTKMISAPPILTVAMRFVISLPAVWILTYASGRRMSFAVLRRTAVAGVLFGT